MCSLPSGDRFVSAPPGGAAADQPGARSAGKARSAGPRSAAEGLPERARPAQSKAKPAGGSRPAEAGELHEPALRESQRYEHGHTLRGNHLATMAMSDEHEPRRVD